MLQQIKRVIKENKILYAFIVPLIDRSILFKIYKLFKQPFKVKLLNGKTIFIYPEGQIAFGVFTKTFEKREIDFFQRVIKPGMTIVDAGANIGLYSLIAAQIVGSTGKIFSFEPSIETFQRLLSNIKVNKFNNIKPLNFGLGDKTNERLILRQDEGYEDAERYLVPNNEQPEDKLANVNKLKKSEEIIIETLDDCLKKNQIQKVDFLKIDTEGYEYYVLKGAQNILLNNPEIIILMECTDLGTSRAKTSQKEVFTILKNCDLNIFYWNHILNEWSDDEGILKAGDLWVCKNKIQLPH